jgi:hypothetical protein
MAAETRQVDAANRARVIGLPAVASDPPARLRRYGGQGEASVLGEGWHLFDREFQTPTRLEIHPSVA